MSLHTSRIVVCVVVCVMLYPCRIFFPFQQYLQLKFKEQTILVFSKDKNIIYKIPDEKTQGKENSKYLKYLEQYLLHKHSSKLAPWNKRK